MQQRSPNLARKLIPNNSRIQGRAAIKKRAKKNALFEHIHAPELSLVSIGSASEKSIDEWRSASPLSPLVQESKPARRAYKPSPSFAPRGCIQGRRWRRSSVWPTGAHTRRKHGLRFVSLASPRLAARARTRRLGIYSARRNAARQRKKRRRRSEI